MNILRITPADHFLGIRHWRQNLPYCRPAYEVFKYVGCDFNTGLHWFKSVRNQCLISKAVHQLGVGSDFGPFCIDDKRIRSVVPMEDEQSNAN